MTTTLPAKGGAVVVQSDETRTFQQMSSDIPCVDPFGASVDTPDTIMEIGYITKRHVND